MPHPVPRKEGLSLSPIPKLPIGAAGRRIALAAVVLLGSRSPLFSAAASAADPDAVARGAYLAGAAGCERCHTDSERGGRPYAGGRELATAFGIIATPNLTPDRATGIGRWSAADFTRAMRWGVAPDDSHYVPAFPFPFYNRLSERDLGDLKAFLDSLPAVSRPALKGAGSTALVARARAAIGVALTPLAGPWQPDPDKDPVWNRGAYLVHSLGRCGDCHTPRTLFGAPDPDRFLAGAPAGPPTTSRAARRSRTSRRTARPASAIGARTTSSAC